VSVKESFRATSPAAVVSVRAFSAGLQPAITAPAVTMAMANVTLVRVDLECMVVSASLGVFN
jgi:hypothetical protein